MAKQKGKSPIATKEQKLRAIEEYNSHPRGARAVSQSKLYLI